MSGRRWMIPRMKCSTPPHLWRNDTWQKSYKKASEPCSLLQAFLCTEAEEMVSLSHTMMQTGSSLQVPLQYGHQGSNTPHKSGLIRAFSEIPQPTDPLYTEVQQWHFPIDTFKPNSLFSRPLLWFRPLKYHWAQWLPSWQCWKYSSVPARERRSAQLLPCREHAVLLTVQFVFNYLVVCPKLPAHHIWHCLLGNATSKRSKVLFPDTETKPSAIIMYHREDTVH